MHETSVTADHHQPSLPRRHPLCGDGGRVDRPARHAVAAYAGSCGVTASLTAETVLADLRGGRRVSLCLKVRSRLETGGLGEEAAREA